MGNCISQKLTDVPQNLFSDMQFLYLSNNQITLLQNTSFKAYLQLVELTLDRNQISSIEMGTFFSLVYMEELSLLGNPLFNLNRNVFQWMCDLQDLILTHIMLSSFIIRIKNMQST